VEETKELESKALAIPERALQIVVACKDDMEKADRFNQDVKAMIKEVDDVFKPMAQKAHEAHKAVTTKWAEIKKPLEEATTAVTQKVRAYIAEEKRKAEAEEARLREIARQQEEERRLAEAEALEKEGRQEEAAAVIEEPMNIITPTVKADVPKYDARTYRDPVVKARVTDMFKFITWCAASPDRIEYLTVNESVLNRKAKSMGKALNIPGVVAYEA
jgi:ElaB/YqjD/DUF883 family membrane-anchored ribosome-binding protein